MATTIIYEAKTTPAAAAQPDGDDIWLSPQDLVESTGWQIKPEGICRDEICIPVPAGKAAGLMRAQGAESWLNLGEFARYMGLPYAHDGSSSVWSFGASPEALRSNLAGMGAPDFTLPDIEGRMHSLSDSRGRKLFLLLWSSW